MKLYKLINGLGIYWVVANDPTEAESKLMKLLNAGDGYGFYGNRTVNEIHLIADQITDEKFLTGKNLVL
jgi:hypothetical protein